MIGSIDHLPSGKWRLRIKSKGHSKSAIFETEQEAKDAQARCDERASNPLAETLRSFGPKVLDWRETVLKYRSSKLSRQQFKTHIEPSSLAALPLREIRQADVERWVDKLTGSVQLRKHCLNLVRRMLAKAKRERLIAENPAIGVTIEGRDVLHWTYLRPAEISRLIAIDDPERCVIAFAIGTGLRLSEQWSLKLEDVHTDGDEPHIIVRFGGRDKPTKTGKPRRVELFGIALDAAREWIAGLDQFLTSPRGKTKYRNQAGLMFPSMRGAYRREKKPPRHWARWLKECSITGATGDRVTWHSLRHTCASALVSGYFGRRWTLQEVAQVLGHDSVETTARYAHLAEGSLILAVKEHARHAGVTGPSAISFSSRATLDSNQRPTAPEALAEVQSIRAVDPPMTPAVTLAQQLLRQMRDGDPLVLSTAVRLAEAVLEGWTLRAQCLG